MTESALRSSRARALTISIALVIAAALFWGMSAMFGSPYSDGPLSGMEGIREAVADNTGEPLPAGQLLTFGCQVLENESPDRLVVEDVALVFGSAGLEQVEGPMYWYADGSPLTCTDFGLPSAILPDLEPPRPDGMPIDPGDMLAVFFGLRYDGTDIAEVIGHDVTYRQGETEYRERFLSGVSVCPVVDPCPFPPAEWP